MHCLFPSVQLPLTNFQFSIFNPIADAFAPEIDVSLPKVTSAAARWEVRLLWRILSASWIMVLIENRLLKICHW